MKSMQNQMIHLHPRNYKEVKGRIVFYFDKNWITQQDFEKVSEEMLKAKTLVITSYRKNEESSRRYTLYVGKNCLQFSESTTENINFYSSKVISGKKVVEKKKDLYKTKKFTIIPSGGVYIVYNHQIIPASDSASNKSWSMDQDVYDDLMQKMEAYFDYDGDDAEENVKEEKIIIKERFRKNVLKPFRDFADKEDWVEKYNQAQGEGVSYFKREYRSKNEKGSVYDFYSRDKNADTEKGLFNVGDRITVVDDSEGNRGVYTGVLNDIDAVSHQCLCSFYHYIT